MTGPLIVITGPTASGKSALALEVAQRYNGEIICADSRTVYKGLDIGTAKPTLEDQKLIRHHLLDIVEPNEPFSAAAFKVLALKAISDILRRGKLPLLVGGTGLYIDAVIFDYHFGDPSEASRREELQELSVHELQQICLEQGIALPTNVKNKRHLVRAIEIGGVINQPKKMRANTIVVALTAEKDELRSRITQRAHQMVEDGVLDELKKVGERYNWSGEAFTGNIYRIFKPVVRGEESIDKALEAFIRSDLQLAKRQITWLKRNPFVIWGAKAQLQIAIEHFVQQIKLSESIPSPRLSATIAKKS